MRRICSWCNAVLEGGTGVISHSMCEACEAAAEAELAAEAIRCGLPCCACEAAPSARVYDGLAVCEACYRSLCTEEAEGDRRCEMIHRWRGEIAVLSPDGEWEER